MVHLSIIIVNYNVRYFLEQCLLSIRKAKHDLSLEIFVVDNHSSDDSLEMVRAKFPEVILIENLNNVGFSSANNQAIELATGKYLLLLNPDTILSEDTLSSCFEFMEVHEDAGAVCVKMIDGSGHYLPESKRGKPTLKASLFKMTGIYKLFPTSGFVNSYYAGHLNEDEMASIEVMTGAFMFLRKTVVDKIGLLDESFFMYGEDIDYSYRVLEAGYKNYYLPSSTIIHFKGESTKKASFNYTKTFYNAMIIFVKKHYKGKGSLYILALQAGVVFKAITSVFSSWIFKLLPAIIDSIFIYFSIVGIKDWWVRFYFNDPDHINQAFEQFNAPFYTIVYILTALLNGHYKKISSWAKLTRTVIIATAIILIIYGLLNVEFRNSRLLILFGSIAAFILLALTKFIKNLFTIRTFGFTPGSTVDYAIVGSESESNRIRHLINSEQEKVKFKGRISVLEDQHENIGNINHLKDIVEAYGIDEVIFSQKDTPAALMMSTMSQMNMDVDFRVAPDDALSIISSRSKDKQGELITVGLSFRINSKDGIFNKRLIDIIFGLIILLISPILIIFNKRKNYFYSNIFDVLLGRKTFVSYSTPYDRKQLPAIKDGIIPCSDNKYAALSTPVSDQENLYYARNYTWWKDLEIITKNLTKLDGTHI